MVSARRTSLPVSALVAVVALMVALLPAGTASATPAPPAERQPAASARTVTLKPALQNVLKRVNKVRRNHGRKPLRVTHCLTKKVAQPWARHMADTGDFAHRDLSKVFKICPSLTMVGENIAAGQPTAKAVMKAWMGSKGHRRNILNKRYRKIGLGLARDADGRPYWVQNFGR